MNHSDYKTAIERSLNLVAEGRGLEALAHLDEALNIALQDDQHKGIVLLARHAALLSEELNVEKTERYCQRALSYAPDDPIVHFALADYYRRVNKTALSRRFARCFKALVDVYRDQDAVELLKSRPDLLSD